MAGTFAPDTLPKVAPSYEEALFADLDTALERLPHARIAIQWDVAVEFGALEGAMGPKLPMEQIVPGLVRCIERVPTDVPVGMHLCYGDYGHQHFKQPESLKMQVDLVNAVTSAAGRAVNFISFTVPQGRNDIAYFEPLSDLTTDSETELYFALVPYHPDDQAPGTTAEQIEHIDAALLNSRTVPPLGDLHGMRDGTRRPRRCAEAARSASQDPLRPSPLRDSHKRVSATRLPRPRQMGEHSAEDEVGLADIKDERRVGQARVRHFMDPASLGARVESLGMKLRIDRVGVWLTAVKFRGPSVGEPVVVSSPTFRTRPVACSHDLTVTDPA